ncbi:phage tail sheath family protein [Corallincola platygyrae]|uniref:Phage tail sheath family protein n=1 Tax=Corallincola platygyrae TaxID=1193278 RepID=A0ABW4XP79_9GAMM
MPAYKTPGVYVEEISVFPPSVAEVETAIPAFVGYTQKATKSTTNDLILKPTKISSMTEFEQYYGDCAFDDISLTIATSGDSFVTNSFTPPDPDYLLWYAMKMFFDNGGGKCYIVSVGLYQTPAVVDNSGDDSDDVTVNSGLLDGIQAVQNEDEPTLLVVPEAVKLEAAEYQALVQAMLTQCNTLQDRFAIFDILQGDTKLDPAGLTTNRGYFGSNHLKYGASYYPFVKTGMSHKVKVDMTNVRVTVNADAETTLNTLETTQTAAFNFAKNKIKEAYVTLPPSSAVAGVYAATDGNRGVWKSPANVSLANVLEPVIKIDNPYQDDLNVDTTTGKSINAIRAFMGKGTLVWGARTLAGNDNEWRYVSVRRFFNMVEESVKKSTDWAVFEPNDANTWVKVRGMIESYLNQKWREGALAGAKPEDAYFVRCGLGVTMNAQDILEGRMNVEIGMAVVRPAEFIILKFSHKLQNS